jgi:hypothetical protein
MINHRTILKQELVTKLYSNYVLIKSVMQHLRSEIDTCPDKKRITKAGHTKRHYYNKKTFINTRTFVY